jgi:hypothetical protein
LNRLLWGWFVFLSPFFLLQDPADHPPVRHARDAISGSRMLADVVRLSAPDFNGRQTGTPDDLVSGRFIADQFSALGLKPRSLVDRVTSTIIEPEPVLEFHAGGFTLPARVGIDYLPILDSPSVNATAPVIFVGYGISDPAHRYDEYERLDVRNRIVLFLRGKPESYAGSVTLAEKERTAREKGALAYLTLTGPILSAYEARKGLHGKPMAIYSQPEGERPLPGAWISAQFAEAVLPAHFIKTGRSLRDIQDQLNHLAPQSMATSLSARLVWDSARTPGDLHNVLGLLFGHDPARSEEVIIIGAHRDHFGRQAGLIFPGADDNASGTAVLLEVARALTQGPPPARSVLFISFSGEEQGLLGSKLYVEHPMHSLKKTVAMINVDHAGIGNGRLTVGVTGVSKDTAMQVGRQIGLADKLDVYGFFPGGDHVPFHEAGVPTITVISSGVHPHFHQPSDTAETVQPDILGEVARYVLELARHLAERP